MKVTLNIENDEELRLHIKDCIKGQVLNIIREELLDIMIEEIERKVKGMSTPNFDYMMKECMTRAITAILRTDHNIGGWNTSFVQPIIEKIVMKVTEEKDWKKLIDEEAKRQIRLLL